MYFILLARLRGDARHLQAGKYSVAADDTPGRLLQRLVLGDVLKYSLTIVEGWTLAQLKNYFLRYDEGNLYKNNVMFALARSDTSACQFALHAMQRTFGQSDGSGDNRSRQSLLYALGHRLQHCAAWMEGCFFPSTYTLHAGQSSLMVLSQAYRLMQRTLHRLWMQRQIHLPYQFPYQALIVASLIEKETARLSEKRRIAGVIVLRLKRHMRLQLDSSVIYAWHRRSATHRFFVRQDFRIRSPYNTYLYRGLPPTPIAIPGYASLYAALHPVLDGSLYFFATPDGRHVFSRNFKAHLRVVRHFRQYSRRKKCMPHSTN